VLVLCLSHLQAKTPSRFAEISKETHLLGDLAGRRCDIALEAISSAQ
jgi:hypothetical protein